MLGDPVLNTDQLGRSRVGPCDIGAVEFEGALTFIIDVRPRRDPNRINPNSNRNINVALLSANSFDATTIDPSTVRFGATGVEAGSYPWRPQRCKRRRSARFGATFSNSDLGIECGATSVTLTGQIWMDSQSWVQVQLLQLGAAKGEEVSVRCN